MPTARAPTRVGGGLKQPPYSRIGKLVSRCTVNARRLRVRDLLLEPRFSVLLFQGSSMVEHAAVNRGVGGSCPSSGANLYLPFGTLPIQDGVL